jgi:hypothetical protein
VVRGCRCSFYVVFWRSRCLNCRTVVIWICPMCEKYRTLSNLDFAWASRWAEVSKIGFWRPSKTDTIPYMLPIYTFDFLASRGSRRSLGSLLAWLGGVDHCILQHLGDPSALDHCILQHLVDPRALDHCILQHLVDPSALDHCILQHLVDPRSLDHCILQQLVSWAAGGLRSPKLDFGRLPKPIHFFICSVYKLLTSGLRRLPELFGRFSGFSAMGWIIVFYSTWWIQVRWIIVFYSTWWIQVRWIIVFYSTCAL